MPELPEVETIVQSLLLKVIGRKITGYHVYRDELRKPLPDFKNVIGKNILYTKRRAKWPAFVLDDGCLWMHLGMTGQILIIEKNDLNKLNHNHSHVHLELDNGKIILYQDPRRFGIIAWTIGKESDPPSDTLGPEPLDKNFDFEMWYSKSKKSSKPIKPWLMDGKNIAGVGNIYASEILFLSKINPNAPVNKLTKKQFRTIHNSTVIILTNAIKNGGSTLRDYRKPDGSLGAAQNTHKVYDKANNPCSICNTIISTDIHSGRTTFWCPKCQPWKKVYEKITDLD